MFSGAARRLFRLPRGPNLHRAATQQQRCHRWKCDEQIQQGYAGRRQSPVVLKVRYRAAGHWLMPMFARFHHQVRRGETQRQDAPPFFLHLQQTLKIALFGRR